MSSRALSISVQYNIPLLYPLWDTPADLDPAAQSSQLETRQLFPTANGVLGELTPGEILPSTSPSSCLLQPGSGVPERGRTGRAEVGTARPPNEDCLFYLGQDSKAWCSG